MFYGGLWGAGSWMGTMDTLLYVTIQSMVLSKEWLYVIDYGVVDLTFTNIAMNPYGIAAKTI